MSFAQIAEVLGSALPRSAYTHRAFWANESTGHVHAKAWLEAGYETAQVDMAGQHLVFQKLPAPAPAAAPPAYSGGMEDEARLFQAPAPAAALPGRHPALGVLKGSFSIAPGIDLTKPALDAPEAGAWEDSLGRKAGAMEGTP